MGGCSFRASLMITPETGSMYSSLILRPNFVAWMLSPSVSIIFSLYRNLRILIMTLLIALGSYW